MEEREQQTEESVKAEETATENINKDDIPLDNGEEVEVEDTPQNIEYDELTGRIIDKNHEKEPLFTIEPRKDGCHRDDHTLLISKKVGFVGLVTFLILSIVFGAINRAWENSLNLLFMGLAVLSYGVQDMIHLRAIAHCNCPECTIARKRLKNIITICVAVAVLLIIFFGVKQFATF